MGPGNAACLRVIEQLTGPILFYQPRQSTQNQLDMIIDLLGSPDSQASALSQDNTSESLTLTSQELMKIPNEKCRKFIKWQPWLP